MHGRTDHKKQRICVITVSLNGRHTFNQSPGSIELRSCDVIVTIKEDIHVNTSKASFLLKAGSVAYVQFTLLLQELLQERS